MSQNSDGFTILEVLITVVIISVALWALSALQTVSIGTNYTSHRMTIATILAQDKMEELRTLAWTDSQLADTQPNFTRDDNGDGVMDDFDWGLTPDHTSANPIDENAQGIVASKATEGYFRSWNIADNVPAPNMKTISVRVQWSEKKARSITINTVLSEG